MEWDPQSGRREKNDVIGRYEPSDSYEWPRGRVMKHVGGVWRIFGNAAVERRVQMQMTV